MTATNRDLARVLPVCSAAALAVVMSACSSSAGSDPAPTAVGSTPAAGASSEATPSSGVGPATTTRIVPAPSGGNVRSHVPSGVAHTKAPVALTEPAPFGRGVSVRIVRHATIHARATRPGEISGPATKLSVRFTNASSTPVDLSHVVVNDQDAKGTPLVALSSAPAAPLQGTLAAGASKTGVYVFELPRARHNPFTIAISYSTAAPVVLLIGDAA